VQSDSLDTSPILSSNTDPVSTKSANIEDQTPVSYPDGADPDKGRPHKPDKVEPKWPIRSPPPSDNETDSDTSSSTGCEGEADNVVLDMDRGIVTFSTA
jgi:hypothetical protein